MDGFRAYLTKEGRLAATQEAAGPGATQVTVPYKKADLLDYINSLLKQEEQLVLHEAAPSIPDPATPQAVEPREPGDSIYRSISQTETQQVDRICGIIFNAPPVTLSRFARSVSMGYVRLEQEGR